MNSKMTSSALEHRVGALSEPVIHKALVWTGIALILATGLIHLIDAPSSFDDATYKGILFLANAAGALVAAYHIYYGERDWGWDLGLIVAGGALVAYIISRTVGLPGLEPDVWLEPLGVASLIVESLFVIVAGYVLTHQAESK